MLKIDLTDEGITITPGKKEMEAFAEIWEKKYVVLIIKDKELKLYFHKTLKDANTTFNEEQKIHPCTLSKIDKERAKYKSRKSLTFIKIKVGKIKL